MDKIKEFLNWLNAECPPGTMTFDLSHDFAEKLRNRLDTILSLQSSSPLQNKRDDDNKLKDEVLQKYGAGGKVADKRYRNLFGHRKDLYKAMDEYAALINNSAPLDLPAVEDVSIKIAIKELNMQIGFFQSAALSGETIREELLENMRKGRELAIKTLQSLSSCPCAGVWVKASERLPDEYSYVKAKICGIELKEKIRYSEGAFFSNDGKLVYTINAFEWLDETQSLSVNDEDKEQEKFNQDFVDAIKDTIKRDHQCAGVWVKAKDRLPDKISHKVVWRWIDKSGANFGYFGEKGFHFSNLHFIGKDKYDKIEWLDETQSSSVKDEDKNLLNKLISNHLKKAKGVKKAVLLKRQK